MGTNSLLAEFRRFDMPLVAEDETPDLLSAALTRSQPTKNFASPAIMFVTARLMAKLIAASNLKRVRSLATDFTPILPLPQIWQ